MEGGRKGGERLIESVSPLQVWKKKLEAAKLRGDPAEIKR